MTDLIIYGAGGFAREVAWLADAPELGCRVVAMLDDDAARSGELVDDVPVMTLDEAAQRHAGAQYVVAVGGGADRQRLAARCDALGLTPATLVHPRVERSRHVTIGPGAVICAGSILTTAITVGAHVQVNLGCTIGHDAALADYVTLAPGVHVSGRVHIEARAYIGTGAVILPGPPGGRLVIGEDAVVGAGAVVTADVAAGMTVVGVPARAREPAHRSAST